MQCRDIIFQDESHTGAGKVDPNAWDGRQAGRAMDKGFYPDKVNTMKRETQKNVRETGTAG